MSGFYTAGKQGLLARSIPADAGLFVVGVNGDYVFDAAHTSLTPFANRVLLPEKALVNPTFVGGILKADNIKWIAAAAGVNDRSLQLTGIIVYFQLAGVGELFAYINSASVGLPQLLTGVDVTAKWDERGILKL